MDDTSTSSSAGSHASYACALHACCKPFSSMWLARAMLTNSAGRGDMPVERRQQRTKLRQFAIAAAKKNIFDVLDPDEKAIVHIANANSREALGDKRPSRRAC
jgi:hypothetical protein